MKILKVIEEKFKDKKEVIQKAKNCEDTKMQVL